jgi:hypothetical protein
VRGQNAGTKAQDTRHLSALHRSGLVSEVWADSRHLNATLYSMQAPDSHRTALGHDSRRDSRQSDLLLKLATFSAKVAGYRGEVVTPVYGSGPQTHLFQSEVKATTTAE